MWRPPVAPMVLCQLCRPLLENIDCPKQLRATAYSGYWTATRAAGQVLPGSHESTRIVSEMNKQINRQKRAPAWRPSWGMVHETMEGGWGKKKTNEASSCCLALVCSPEVLGCCESRCQFQPVGRRGSDQCPWPADRHACAAMTKQGRRPHGATGASTGGAGGGCVQISAAPTVDWLAVLVPDLGTWGRPLELLRSRSQQLKASWARGAGGSSWACGLVAAESTTRRPGYQPRHYSHTLVRYLPPPPCPPPQLGRWLCEIPGLRSPRLRPP